MTRSDGRPPARAPEFGKLQTWRFAYRGHPVGTARIAVDLLGGDDAPDVVVDGALPGPYAEPQQYVHLARRRHAAGEALVVPFVGRVAS